MAVWCAAFAAAESVPWRFSHAHSMLTHDGRRLVSRVEGTNTVYELVPTNRLPANMSLSRYDLNVGSPAWNVQLLTLKRAEDGRGLIARFREREGRPCRVTASQHLAPDAEYTLCNVVERDVRNKALITE